MDIPAIYTRDGLGAEFRQSEIVSGLTFYDYSSTTGNATSYPMEYCVLVSQDCDLLREHETPGALFHILMCRVRPATEARSLMPGSDVWKRAKQNNDERYQLLQACDPAADLANEGMPDLVIDFREMISIRPQELRDQCAKGLVRRRTWLTTPYREHFQLRVTNYLSRIALPVPHRAV